MFKAGDKITNGIITGVLLGTTSELLQLVPDGVPYRIQEGEFNNTLPNQWFSTTAWTLV